MEATALLFSLLRVLFGDAPPIAAQTPPDAETLEKVYALAQLHDISPMLAQALEQTGLLDNSPACEKFKKAALSAVFRYERSQYELHQISETLQKAAIPFIPLKGAVIRAYYPEPWLRTSCDLDVLVKEEDLPRAVQALTEECHYTANEKKDFHDISLHTPTGLHLELHFSINESIKSLDSVLSTVWQHATPDEDMPCRHTLSNEFLLFHVVAHMAYHFLYGGCGIRPLVDLLLLQKALPVDEAAISALLAQAELTAFYAQLQALCGVWFEGLAHTDLTRQMERFIVSGGAYGSLQNRVTIQQQRKNGKLLYLKNRIFLSKKGLLRLYPKLQNHRWLLPLAQVHRWLTLASSKRSKKALQELTYSRGVTKEESAAIKQFIHDMGL